MSKQNKEYFLGQIHTTQFNNKIIIAIDKKWGNFFQNTPSFEAVIEKNGKYTLRGPMVRQHHRRIPTVAQEDTADE